MGRLESHRAEILAAGGRLAAISVDSRDTSRLLAKSLELGFPLLADEDMATIDSYGVHHPGKTISLPAVFVVDSKGLVRYARISRSVGDRPDEAELVQAVRAANQAAR